MTLTPRKETDMTGIKLLSARIAALEEQAAPLEALRAEYGQLNDRLDQLDDLIQDARAAKDRLTQLEGWCREWSDEVAPTPEPAAEAVQEPRESPAVSPDPVVVDTAQDEPASEPTETTPAAELWQDKDLSSGQRILLYLEMHPAQSTVDIAAGLDLLLATVASACSVLQKSGQLEAVGEKPRLYSLKTSASPIATEPAPKPDLEQMAESVLTADERLVLDEMQRGGIFTTWQLCQRTKIAFSRIERTLTGLIRLNLITTRGNGYIIASETAAD